MSVFSQKHKNKQEKKPTVTIIGSGIAGLATAWLLTQSGKYQVKLLEADNRFGGHANAVGIELEGKKALVDTGFLVFNYKTYPHLTQFFKHLDVDICDSDMSFGLSIKKRFSYVEWAGDGLAKVFAQKRRLFSRAHWKMLRDILRMGKAADVYLEESRRDNLTLGELLDRHGFSDSFQRNYLLPMAAAIWSTSVDDIRKFPAETFLSFCKNHVLLDIKGRPQWKTVMGTSAMYVQKVIGQLQDARTYHRVSSIKQVSDKHEIQVQTPDGDITLTSDITILACHTDQAANIVGKVATQSQKKILTDITYAPNKAYLHTDASLMPLSRKVWSSWNYLADDTGKLSKKPKQSRLSDTSPNAVTISYWINRLQPFVPFKTDVFVTLNPTKPIDPKKIIAEFDYAHPQMTKATVDAQKRLEVVQGDNGLYFAGAWTRYGFHEDGILSAVKVAEHLGVSAPWLADIADWDKDWLKNPNAMKG